MGMVWGKGAGGRGSRSKVVEEHSSEMINDF
jgi:hypothetical protein